ncbi:hypothetical protein DSCO28_56360 [Desulfosarcina ovata subsp. sediminis]|uniref:Sigma-54 factor interaction domain-containing protein n=1 Tax=Desulfosarcina ovata subsp. sediminis TaxID=885957 RepID=A0A5K7ZYA1_9BACT|nr:sigma 54-interacting transcriptional regulator [Desulfosarcina ovata]BBO85070.1 hypothetical protein DSCO28_56360 [Desulfosarcina ovata subsp. sediminis]
MTTLDFTAEQLEFLSVLDAFNGPVPINIVGSLSPLPPGELLDLLRRGKEINLISEPDQDMFALTEELPQNFINVFGEINDKEKIDSIVRQLSQLNLWEEIPFSQKANLLAQSGNEKEAGLLFAEIAQTSLENKNECAAYDNLINVINILPAYLGENVVDTVFVKACQQLCYLCNYFGRYVSILPPVLKFAIEAADRLGDKRSKAILNFHLGFYHFTFGRSSEALQNLETGRLIVEDLGDDDMLMQSSGFMGLYYFFQGLNKEALDMFEKVDLNLGTRTGFLYGPNFLAYSAAYSGHFDRAIGCLDYYYHLAQRMGREPIASIYRASLGKLLIATHKLEDAKHHLLGALEANCPLENEFAGLCAESGLAFYYYRHNNLIKVSEYLDRFYARMMKSRITILSLTPWWVQMVYNAEKQGYQPPPAFSCQNLIENLAKEKNIHLKGISLRLKAKSLSFAGNQKEAIKKLLYKSEACADAASDPIQLGISRLEVAKLKVNEGDIKEACRLAMQARLRLSGQWEFIFPDDLRFLLDKYNDRVNENHFGDGFIEDFINKLSELPYHYSIDHGYSNVLAFTNRAFRAERGAIFWMDSIPKKVLQPKSFKNMSASDLHAESFRPYMAAIIRCQKENRPILTSHHSLNNRSNTDGPLSALCLPICMNGICRGVLYHDNTYVCNCFEQLSKKDLEQVSVHLERYFIRCFEFNKAIEDTKKNAVREAAALTENSGANELIASCQPMVELLDQADKVARTDSTVLIMGETGVGKEVLAKRIHMMSPRASTPFITVDATTIPDNLVESELFGHEKGSFTGADRQKIGRLELADKGTLFIDEVGELPLPTQAKLLRVLQEKTFIRVGGTLPLESNFRLVVATNRKLEEEVKNKRFREDLYFRLNTVPLILPPLRERGKDIIELARYFLRQFSAKYKHDDLRLSTEDEKKLRLYHWPGNIRELEHVIERAVILSKGDKIELNIMDTPKPIFVNESSELVTLDELQRRYILHVLVKTGGKIYGSGGAAEILGINRGTLYSRMKKLGIKL